MKKIFLTLTLILFVITFGISQDLPSYVPADGLVAFYPFNGNANDVSGNGNHGTVNGATLTTDRYNNADNAYVFDNSNIEIPHQFYSNGWNDYTITLWFLTSDKTVSSQAILNTIPHDGEGLNFNHPHHINVFSHYKSSDLNIDNWDIWSGNEFSINVENNIWYMISIVKHNDEYKYYINNQLISTSINTLSAQNQLTGFTIGSITQENNNQENLLGKLDDIGFWNKALSQEEMQNLYNSSTGDILLNGVVSAENNQIKNVADPTHTQDAATKGYVDSNLNSFSGSYNDLTDTPTMYTQAQVNALISNLQSQISDLKGEVVDNEGNVYSSVQLGNQLWTTINAENTTYRDGTAIPQVTDLNTWPNLTTGAWCYIDNDPSKGKLYNWFAVVGIHNEASLTDTSLRKEFAPQGWKIPSNDDFSLLVNYLIANGYNHDGTVTGNKLAKSLASQSGWGVTTGNGLPGTDQSLNNSSGFNALPVGVYKFNGTGWYFLNKGSEADFWTLTEHDSDEDLARYAALIFDRDWLTQWYIPKNNGASVRFIKE